MVGGSGSYSRGMELSVSAASLCANGPARRGGNPELGKVAERTPAARVHAWRKWFGLSFEFGLSGPTVENSVVDDVQVLEDLGPVNAVNVAPLSPVSARSSHTSHSSSRAPMWRHGIWRFRVRRCKGVYRATGGRWDIPTRCYYKTWALQRSALDSHTGRPRV